MIPLFLHYLIHSVIVNSYGLKNCLFSKYYLFQTFDGLIRFQLLPWKTQSWNQGTGMTERESRLCIIMLNHV